MKYDTNLKLGEIVNSKEALLKSIEDIIDKALFRVSDYEPLKLRFITPSVPLEEWLEDEQCASYELTLPDQHSPGMKYVAVSYCWAHEQSKEGITPFPDYYIDDRRATSSGPKRISCPDLVLHRAIAFARKKKCPYIWIDQECIYQDDAADKQKHLKLMHRVYHEAAWSIAVLAQSLPDDDAARTLLRLDQAKVLVELPEFIENVKALHEAAKDPWFRRTWALQEKECAKDMILLLPRSPTSNEVISTDRYTTANDYWISLSDVQSSIFPTNNMFVPQWSMATCTDVGEARLSKEVHSLFPLYGTQFAEGEAGQFGPFSIAFEKTECCDNLLVADRVSIIGNICNLEFRLLPDPLHDSNSSYSIWVWAKYLVNCYSTREERAKFVECKGGKFLSLSVREHFSPPITLRSYSEYLERFFENESF